MTTITEIGHAQFNLLMKNKQFKQHVIKEQDNVISALFISLLTIPTQEHTEFIKGIVQLRNKYFIYCDSGNVLLITKDFKGMIKFNIRKPNELFKSHFNDNWMIEIDNLNSIKRGNGKQLLKDVLGIASKINVEVCLWTENDRNTNYFDNYGFSSVGKIGRNNENLMIKRK
ncbi:hypothetical protein [Staphylococcus lugdunensis]|uniref:GNAT family N-acetyltransferase n=1 Tax=Staphylococcus lugdunensis TaxID=28035 RepID=A0ABD4EGT0_STALU|nr:hypothetical protein [Staphylococcus lugdunensis]KXA38889.1 hypothetical protein HMPREF3225_00994 [Staphylococcus lugdunensis]MCO7040707.1 hypothetical protein [Staphylococcus lugdunensis]QEX29662.1 hypothetical protein FO458_10445 [Staphylococcus lugdunensis]